MAVVWQHQKEGTAYEVRQAGQTTRLYSNGVLHSQYNPKHIISGAIWDLLLLPAFLKKEPPQTILLLGLGGGALLHMIRHCFPQTEIDCVEIDPTHIQIAKRWFKIPTKNIEIHQGDAYDFLHSTNQRYDWIIDDVFQHVTGDPERSMSIGTSLALCRKRLCKNGLISMNLIGQRQFTELKACTDVPHQAVQFTHPLYDNRIIAMADQLEPLKDMKLAMNEFTVLNQSRKTCKLKYRVKKLR